MAIDQFGLVGNGGQRVETLAEVAVQLPLVHQFKHLEHVVDLVQLGQPVEAPVVLLGGGGAEPAFHQADVELAVVLPVGHLAGAERLEGPLADVGLEVGLLFAWQGQVTRQEVGQQPQVGKPLDVGVPSQGVHPASRHAHVAQQELHHGRGTDHLRSHRVLGPAEGVHEGQGAVGYRGGGDDLAHLEEGILRCAADIAHHVRRVAGIVLF